MRSFLLIGSILVLCGIGGLVIQNVSFTETKNVVDLGPIQVQSEEKHNLHIPTIASIAAIIAGFGLIILSRRKP